MHLELVQQKQSSDVLWELFLYLCFHEWMGSIISNIVVGVDQQEVPFTSFYDVSCCVKNWIKEMTFRVGKTYQNPSETENNLVYIVF